MLSRASLTAIFYLLIYSSTGDQPQGLGSLRVPQVHYSPGLSLCFRQDLSESFQSHCLNHWAAQAGLSFISSASASWVSRIIGLLQQLYGFFKIIF